MSSFHSLDLLDDGQRNSNVEHDECNCLGFYIDVGVQTDLVPMKRSAEEELSAMEGAPA